MVVVILPTRLQRPQRRSGIRPGPGRPSRLLKAVQAEPPSGWPRHRCDIRRVIATRGGHATLIRAELVSYRPGVPFAVATAACLPAPLDGSCCFVATQVLDPTRGLQSRWLRLLATS